MFLRTIFLLAALLHVSPAMAELHPVTENGKALMKQGMTLEGEGKPNEALQRYKEAALADPKASMPLSYIANLYYRSSQAAPAKEVASLRQTAAATANAALKLDERDPMAMEVLRALGDDTPQVRHQPTDAAQKAITEGELLFHDKKFTAAAEKYALAITLDPASAESYLLLGDCYYMQNDLVQSEHWFLKATQVDPLYGAAWRFLFDAQIRQEKFKDAEASAIGAIAARPSDRQSWMRAGQWMERGGNQLTPFRLFKRATFKDNKVELNQGESNADNGIWLAYGMALAKTTHKMPKASPFALELEAWETTMKVMDELDKKDPVKDEGLRAMLRFQKAGELKAAIFLLLYREAYRPDFEAWKKANPDAIKQFIRTFQLGI